MALGGEPRCPHCGGGMSGGPPIFTQTTHARPPVLCPVCRGVTTMPTSFYDPIAGSVNKREKCRTCNGKGVT